MRGKNEAEPSPSLLVGLIRCSSYSGVCAATSSRHAISKFNVNASAMPAVRFGCCQARSQLCFYHIIVSQLVRSGENETPDCPWAVWGSAPNPRSAFGSILGSFFDPSGDLWSSIGTRRTRKYVVWSARFAKVL